MDDGYGEERRTVMYNDFVMVGPDADPAEIRSEMSVLDAFRTIARTESPFVSRGDNSGTHMQERSIWEQAATEPHGSWYIEAGAGMAEILRIADERHAYTLADRATFLAHRGQLNLSLLLEGDPMLQNQYSVILVNSQKHPHIKRDQAYRFVAFLMAPKTQSAISEFGVQKFGQPLFFIMAPESLPTE
jgi:tungstate transport system substrate-binding protein